MRLPSNSDESEPMNPTTTLSNRPFALRGLFCAAILALAGSTALAQTPSQAVIYPAKGQNAKQQDQDQYECYSWSRAQSGFDPAQATPVASSPAKSSTNTAASMVAGAAGGAAVAQITNHDAGRGAAYGALGGGLLARVRDKQVNQAAQQQAQQQQAGRGQQRARYDRAFGACMEARSYVVK